MKRVRINATAGKMVNAGGQWLTCIGNIPHRVGDFVWSDGRCAYGNLIESDEYVMPVQCLEGIPLNNRVKINDQYFAFYIDPKGKLKYFSVPFVDPFKDKPAQFNNHIMLLNNKSTSFYLSPAHSFEKNKTSIIDADISNNNKDIWAICSPEYNLDYGNFFADKISTLQHAYILKNGEVHFDYSDIIRSIHSEVYSNITEPSVTSYTPSSNNDDDSTSNDDDSTSNDDDSTSNDDDLPSEVVLDESYISVENAIINSDGSYSFFVSITDVKFGTYPMTEDGDVSLDSWIYSSWGSAVYFVEDGDYHPIEYNYATQSLQQYEDKLNNKSNVSFSTTKSSQKRANDIKYPIGDGWYYTVTAPDDIKVFGQLSPSKIPYSVFVFDNKHNKRFYMKFPQYYQFGDLRIYPISKNKFFVSSFWLNDNPNGYIAGTYPAIISVDSSNSDNNGIEAKFVDFLHTNINNSDINILTFSNYRLRKMRNINKFKHAAKIYKYEE